MRELMWIGWLVGWFVHWRYAVLFGRGSNLKVGVQFLLSLRSNRCVTSTKKKYFLLFLDKIFPFFHYVLKLMHHDSWYIIQTIAILLSKSSHPPSRSHFTQIFSISFVIMPLNEGLKNYLSVPENLRSRKKNSHVKQIQVWLI